MKTSTLKGISDADLRAANELKESRDFKYSTNQSLQTLSQGIVSLSLQHEKVMAKTESDRKALLIEFENLREWILSRFNEMNQKLGDAQTKLFQVLDEFTDLKEEVQTSYLTKEDFDNIHDDLYNKIVSNHLKQTLKSDNINHDYNNLKGQIKEDLEKLRVDLTPIPPEVDPVDIKLDERFRVFKIDFDGLVKEITLLKKAVMYDQKKFENVYTLIERLKEGKECHKKV